MQLRPLGSTNTMVPNICLGTMTWGSQNTEAEAHEQLDYAVRERGVTFLDTAEVYPYPPTPERQGATETIIGNWLKDHEKRDELVVASKVSASGILKTRDPRDGRYDKASIREALEGSLRRLQTDYLDLYQIHWPERSTNFFNRRGYVHDPNDDATPIRETLEGLAELIEEGKVRHIGVSNETPWGIAEYLRLSREEGLPRIVSIQNQYSLTNRTFEIGLAEFAMREAVGLLAYSPLNMGVLTGKYIAGARPEGARFTRLGRNSDRYNHAQAEVATRRYVEVAHAHGYDQAQLAIAFVLSREFTTAAIIGATSMEQLSTCIDAAEIVLTDAVLADIEEIYKEMPDPTC